MHLPTLSNHSLIIVNASRCLPRPESADFWLALKYRVLVCLEVLRFLSDRVGAEMRELLSKIYGACSRVST